MAASALEGHVNDETPQHVVVSAPRAGAGRGLVSRLASLVKLEHTIFALPFAYVGAFLAVDAFPGWAQLAWITLAMAGARTLAMALNRLIDAEQDASNPRTASRELPAGALSRAQVLALCVGALLVFLVAVFRLDPVVRWLWPIPVVLFVVYPYLKRVTWLCHFWLGACLGLAPVGAWVAVSGQFGWQAWTLGAAVALWVSGFDLFYSLFDLEHDRLEGLHSWATRWGAGGVFGGARLLHATTVALLAAAGLGLDVGLAYWLGVVAVAGLLAYEHTLVHPGDLRRLDAAFFTVNGIISVVFFGFVAIDTLA
jgi:4-hydroxybenzoate polyprenyltransferase